MSHLLRIIMIHGHLDGIVELALDGHQYLRNQRLRENHTPASDPSVLWRAAQQRGAENP